MSEWSAGKIGWRFRGGKGSPVLAAQPKVLSSRIRVIRLMQANPRSWCLAWRADIRLNSGALSWSLTPLNWESDPFELGV
jgi:hypothetical protein